MTSQTEDRVYHYEFFSGVYVPDEILDRANNEGWELGTTTKRPPYAVKGVAVYTHKTDSWYIRPVANNNVAVRGFQWEVNPLAFVSAKDAKNGNWYVVDDVFMDIDKVLKDGETLQYDVRTWNFYGMTSDTVDCSALYHLVGSIIGRPVTKADNSMGASFKNNEASDWYKHNRIHSDVGSEWAVIIYLNETEDPRRKGTCLYQYENHPVATERKTWTDEFIKEMFVKGYDPDNFKVHYCCPLVKNRMFIYRGNILHDVGEFFDGRKVFRMFLKEREILA